MTCGERVRQQREQKGWSLRELSRRTRIDAATLSRLETGDRVFPTMEQGIRLARAFGVSLDFLVGLYNDEGDLVPAVELQEVSL